MLLLAEVTILLPMGLWNATVDFGLWTAIHYAALCVDSNVNLFSMIGSITNTHLVKCKIHASKTVNCLNNHYTVMLPC